MVAQEDPYEGVLSGSIEMMSTDIVQDRNRKQSLTIRTCAKKRSHIGRTGGLVKMLKQMHAPQLFRAEMEPL